MTLLNYYHKQYALLLLMPDKFTLLIEVHVKNLRVGLLGQCIHCTHRYVISTLNIKQTSVASHVPCARVHARTDFSLSNLAREKL